MVSSPNFIKRFKSKLNVQANIERGDAVGEGADGDEIDAGFGGSPTPVAQLWVWGLNPTPGFRWSRCPPAAP